MERHEILDKQLKDVLGAEAFDFYRAGEILLEMRKGRMFEALGYATIVQYLQNYSLDPSGFRLMQIAEVFSPEEIKGFSFFEASEITDVAWIFPSPLRRKEIIANVRGKPWKEAQKTLDAYRNTGLLFKKSSVYTIRGGSEQIAHIRKMVKELQTAENGFSPSDVIEHALIELSGGPGVIKREIEVNGMKIDPTRWM